MAGLTRLDIVSMSRAPLPSIFNEIIPGLAFLRRTFGCPWLESRLRREDAVPPRAREESEQVNQGVSNHGKINEERKSRDFKPPLATLTTP